VPAPVGAGLDSSRAPQDTAAVEFLNSDDDEVDDEHSTFASHASNSRVHTPQRQSPGSQPAAQMLSPAEAGKQALIIEKERDALLSSGLYLENGEACTSACIVFSIFVSMSFSRPTYFRARIENSAVTDYFTTRFSFLTAFDAVL
jgi:hypothetical protein